MTMTEETPPLLHVPAFDLATAMAVAIPDLHRQAKALIHSSASPEDLVQDTLEKAWQGRSTFVEGSNLKAWLFRIMRNQLIDTIRRKRIVCEDFDAANAADVGTPAGQLGRLEVADLLQAIDTLPCDMRRALLLVGTEVTNEEAAAISGCPVGTLKSRLRRGRASLIQAGH